MVANNEASDLNGDEGLLDFVFGCFVFLFFLIIFNIVLLVCICVFWMYGWDGWLYGVVVLSSCAFPVFLYVIFRVFFSWFFMFDSNRFAYFSLGVCKHQEALKKICGFSLFLSFLAVMPEASYYKAEISSQILFCNRCF